MAPLLFPVDTGTGHHAPTFPALILLLLGLMLQEEQALMSAQLCTIFHNRDKNQKMDRVSAPQQEPMVMAGVRMPIRGGGYCARFGRYHGDAGQLKAVAIMLSILGVFSDYHLCTGALLMVTIDFVGFSIRLCLVPFVIAAAIVRAATATADHCYWFTSCRA